MASTTRKPPSHRSVPIAELIEHPMNPRQGDVGAIVSSIEANGWFGEVTAQLSTGHILDGNHRHRAMVQLGENRIQTHFVDVDDATALRILLAANRIGDLAPYDAPVLASVLTAIVTNDSLVGTGWDGDDLDALLSDIARDGGDLDLSDLGDVLNDGLTPAEREASWRESGIRSFILPYSSDEFETIVDAFAVQRSELGCDTNADVVAVLLGVR